MRQKTCGCLGIRTVKSKGESIIHHFLLKHNIAVQFQKRFEGCKNVIPLPFDFYLPDYNMCIEFNGRQHYNWKDCYTFTQIYTTTLPPHGRGAVSRTLRARSLASGTETNKT